jgi:hypothetical protein
MEQLSLQSDQRDRSLGRLGTEFSFNIGYIGRVSDPNTYMACSSVCCVMGAAALDPELEELTGQFVSLDFWGAFERLDLYLNGEPVEYDGPDLAEWFGLSVHDHEELTNATGYEAGDDASPEDVISKIDRYLQEAGYEVPQKTQELVTA